MAKKRAKATPTKREAGRVDLKFRFDADLHELLRQAADEAGVSLNQLVQGICRAAAEVMHAGEAERLNSGFVTQRSHRKQCLFFGRPGNHEKAGEEHPDYMKSKYGDAEPPQQDNGVLWFSLDFSERGSVHRHM
jgi:uncharacterized protein (DUF1778 family)